MEVFHYSLSVAFRQRGLGRDYVYDLTDLQHVYSMAVYMYVHVCLYVK